MKRIVISILLLFACLSAARGDAPSATNAVEVPLRWGADSEGGAPYICKNPKDPNGYEGFEVDLAAALQKELGRRIVFVQYDFKNLVAGLRRGDIDFGMNGIEITPDREKALRLSRPYYAYTLQLVARADESRFGSLESCKRLGGVVGTLEDTAAERLLDKMGVKKKVYGNQVEPYVDLELGRLDAVLLDWPIATYIAKPRPKLKFVGPPRNPGRIKNRWPSSLTPLWIAWPRAASCAAFTRSGTSGTTINRSSSTARTRLIFCAKPRANGVSPAIFRCCWKGPS
jgi:ABC-type amino acid transport substrate-binding protein